MKHFTILILVIFGLGITAANAQINLGKKLKNESNNRANKNVDNGIDKTFDAAEGAVKDLFKKKKPEDQNNEDQPQPEQNTETTQAGQQQTSPGLQSYSNYDFVPGDKVLLYEDFSQDAVGDFPALWTTTYGIYFDVNKDVVKPESYGTLKDIAKILNEVPDVKVKILGHTDADGQDAANLDLSKRRAASVKAELAKTFGVNADRFETDGMGEIQPVASNDTPVNKALNRRVEFVKL
jgi:outer membrane protein OmpA-like peptidoglycan-associated protein